MLGAGGAIVSLATASTGCPASIRFVSCMVFPPKRKSREAAAEEARLPLSRVMPLPAARRPICRGFHLRIWATIWPWGSSGARQSVVIGSREMFSKACRQRFGTMKKSNRSGRSSADIADHPH
jgi:hypothetical protein